MDIGQLRDRRVVRSLNCHFKYLCRDSGCFRRNELKSNSVDRLFLAPTGLQEPLSHPICTQILHDLLPLRGSTPAHLRPSIAIRVNFPKMPKNGL
jgi:hypothetical protein